MAPSAVAPLLLAFAAAEAPEPLAPLPAPSTADLAAAIHAGASYLLRRIDGKGKFVYRESMPPSVRFPPVDRGRIELRHPHVGVVVDVVVVVVVQTHSRFVAEHGIIQ